MTKDCVFCDHDRLREADLCFENDFCIGWSPTCADRPGAAQAQTVLGSW